MMKDYDYFVRQAVAKAEDVRRGLRGSFAEVKAIVDDHELVFAVWHDGGAPDGIGMMIVKGKPLLRNIASAGQIMRVRWTAIPCIEVEQAEALRRAIAEPDPVN